MFFDPGHLSIAITRKTHSIEKLWKLPLIMAASWFCRFLFRSCPDATSFLIFVTYKQRNQNREREAKLDTVPGRNGCNNGPRVYFYDSLHLAWSRRNSGERQTITICFDITFYHCGRVSSHEKNHRPLSKSIRRVFEQGQNSSLIQFL